MTLKSEILLIVSNSDDALESGEDPVRLPLDWPQRISPIVTAVPSR